MIRIQQERNDSLASYNEAKNEYLDHAIYRKKLRARLKTRVGELLNPPALEDALIFEGAIVILRFLILHFLVFGLMHEGH